MGVNKNFVFIIDKNLKIIYANEYFFEISGYKFKDIYKKKINAFIDKFLDKPILSETVNENIFIKLKNQLIYGTLFTYEVKKKKIFILFFLIDQKYYKNFIEEERLKLLEIIHDLNNMLTVALTTISLINTKKQIDESCIEILKQCLYSIKGMSIDFSNYLEHKDLNKKYISVIKILENSLKLSCYNKHLINYEIINNAKNYHIWANESELLRAFFNIFHNCCEAMKDTGEIKVYIENVVIKSENKKQSFVQISIKDTGPQFNDTEKIFDAFFSSKGKGRGLGLYIVRKIIENLNGKIEAISNNINNIKFIIYLPITDN